MSASFRELSSLIVMLDKSYPRDQAVMKLALKAGKALEDLRDRLDTQLSLDCQDEEAHGLVKGFYHGRSE